MAGVPAITFRLTRSQIVMQYVLVVVGIAVGVLGAAAATGSAVNPGFLAPLVGALIGSSLALRYRVTLTVAGVEIRRNGTEQVPWHAIRYIDTVKIMGSTVVRLHYFNGKTRRLPAPVTWALQPDREFQPKLATLVQWWMFYTGQLQPPAQPDVAPQQPA